MSLLCTYFNVDFSTAIYNTLGNNCHWIVSLEYKLLLQSLILMWNVPSLSALFIWNQVRALSQGCLNTECSVTSGPKVCSVFYRSLAIKCPITDRLIWCSYWVKWIVTFSKFNVYKFWDLCNGVPEGSTFLGYGAASMDNQILTFWGKAKSSSSRFKILCCLHMFGSSYPLMHHNIPEEQKLKLTAASYCVHRWSSIYTWWYQKKINYLMGAAKSAWSSTI